MTDNSAALEDQPTTRWRFRLGLTIFIVGFASPLLIPLVTASGLPTQ